MRRPKRHPEKTGAAALAIEHAQHISADIPRSVSS
jgi:hypothetical protein